MCVAADDLCVSTHVCIDLLVFIGWNDKCGSWTADPFNDYCYLFNYLSMRTWAEAQADCVNQGGDLLSITDPFEQAFLQGAHFTFVLFPINCISQGCDWSLSSGNILILLIDIY